MKTVAEIVRVLETIAPLNLSADWDNTGLLLGHLQTPVDRVMTCLTLTEPVAAEAIAAGVQLVIPHHPILFRAAKRITTAKAEGRMLLALSQAGVSVYSPHTAWDNAPGGINDQLGQAIGLAESKALRRGSTELISRIPPVKIVVFVPEEDLSQVLDALFQAGAGRIGQYRECSYRLAGTGTFFGTEGTNPTVGQKGRREEVAEWRLEVVSSRADLPQVLQALRRSHSYEEPAFDVYPLLGDPGNPPGEGRVGTLAQPAPLEELAIRLRQSLGWGPVGLVGDRLRIIEKVAIVCGSGGELLADAVRAGVDLFLTGEMRYHDYLSAQDQGIALMLPGHHATERLGMDRLADQLAQLLPDLQVWASREECDPVSWIY